MRKLVGVSVAALLVAASSPASVARPTPVVREEVLEYQGPAQVGVGTPQALIGYVALDKLRFETGAGEKWVVFDIADGVSAAVTATVSLSEDSYYDDVVFCSATPDPIQVPPNSSIWVWLWRGTCPDGTPSLPTTGSITAQFARNAKALAQ